MDKDTLQLRLMQYDHERNIAYTKDLNAEHLMDRKLIFDSIMHYGELSIKSGIMINGAAAIAVLALLGNIWHSSSSNNMIIIGLLLILTKLSYGVFFSGMGAILAYVTQYLYYSKTNSLKIAYFMHLMCGVATIGGFVCFFLAVNELTNVTYNILNL